MPAPLTSIAAREAFHIMLLQRMMEGLPKDSWRLKGGVNMRLFFGSLRCSEDMDLDADLRARESIRSGLKKILNEAPFGIALAERGIRAVHRDGSGIHKDTETTLRFKMRLEVQGGVMLPTKVDISFRPSDAKDLATVESADERIVDQYLAPTQRPLLVPHYHRTAAIRQKISALAKRTHVEARDVFDLYALAHGHADSQVLRLLRTALQDETLVEAEKRALEIPYEAYSSKVLEFLDDNDRAKWADRWEDQQLFVADMAREVRELPTESDDTPAESVNSHASARQHRESR